MGIDRINMNVQIIFIDLKQKGIVFVCVCLLYKLPVIVIYWNVALIM